MSRMEFTLWSWSLPVLVLAKLSPGGARNFESQPTRLRVRALKAQLTVTLMSLLNCVGNDQRQCTPLLTQLLPGVEVKSLINIFSRGGLYPHGGSPLLWIYAIFPDSQALSVV